MAGDDYSSVDRAESDHARAGFAGFVVPGGHPGSVLDIVDKRHEEAEPLIFDAVVRNRASAFAFGGPHSRAISLGDVFTDEGGIAAAQIGVVPFRNAVTSLDFPAAGRDDAHQETRRSRLPVQGRWGNI